MCVVDGTPHLLHRAFRLSIIKLTRVPAAVSIVINRIVSPFIANKVRRLDPALCRRLGI